MKISFTTRDCSNCLSQSTLLNQVKKGLNPIIYFEKSLDQFAIDYVIDSIYHLSRNLFEFKKTDSMYDPTNFNKIIITNTRNTILFSCKIKELATYLDSINKFDNFYYDTLKKLPKETVILRKLRTKFIKDIGFFFDYSKNELQIIELNKKQTSIKKIQGSFINVCYIYKQFMTDTFNCTGTEIKSAFNTDPISIWNYDYDTLNNSIYVLYSAKVPYSFLRDTNIIFTYNFKNFIVKYNINNFEQSTTPQIIKLIRTQVSSNLKNRYATNEMGNFKVLDNGNKFLITAIYVDSTMDEKHEGANYLAEYNIDRKTNYLKLNDTCLLNSINQSTFSGRSFIKSDYFFYEYIPKIYLFKTHKWQYLYGFDSASKFEKYGFVLIDINNYNNNIYTFYMIGKQFFYRVTSSSGKILFYKDVTYDNNESLCVPFIKDDGLVFLTKEKSLVTYTPIVR